MEEDSRNTLTSSMAKVKMLLVSMCIFTSCRFWQQMGAFPKYTPENVKCRGLLTHLHYLLHDFWEHSRNQIILSIQFNEKLRFRPQPTVKSSSRLQLSNLYKFFLQTSSAS